MIAPFDVFKTEGEGVRWICCADDLDTAKKRVQTEGKTHPGEYFIISLKTQNRISMTVKAERTNDN